MLHRSVTAAFVFLMSTPAGADVVTNFDIATTTRVHDLFFPEGTNVTRGECDDGSIVRDRARCAGSLRSVPIGMFEQELFALVGSEMDLLQTQAAEHQVMIDRADLRLLDLIDAEPTPVDSTLRPAMDAKLDEFQAAERDVAAFADQIARLKRLLTDHEDPDIRAELRERQIEYGDAVAQRSRLGDELNDLRKRYCDANSAIVDPTVYRMIQGQRRDHVGALADKRSKLEWALAQRMGAVQLVKLVADQGYTYEITSQGSTPPEEQHIRFAASRMRTAFANAIRNWSEFPAVADSHGATLRIHVPREGRILAWRCDLSWSGSSGCSHVRVEHEESGLQLELPQASFNVKASASFPVEVQTLFDMSAVGHWKIAAYCRVSPVQLLRNDCRMELK